MDFRLWPTHPIAVKQPEFAHSHCLLHLFQPKPFRFQARIRCRLTFFTRDALTTDAATLKSIFSDYPDAVVVEGHCDERGSAEYNLGLGDRRATAATDFLVQLGVPADRLKTISYGKEPVCTESKRILVAKEPARAFLAGAVG